MKYLILIIGLFSTSGVYAGYCYATYDHYTNCIDNEVSKLNCHEYRKKVDAEKLREYLKNKCWNDTVKFISKPLKFNMQRVNAELDKCKNNYKNNIHSKKYSVALEKVKARCASKKGGRCDYPWQLDSLGRRCGARAASVRPGGLL